MTSGELDVLLKATKAIVRESGTARSLPSARDALRELGLCLEKELSKTGSEELRRFLELWVGRTAKAVDGLDAFLEDLGPGGKETIG